MRAELEMYNRINVVVCDSCPMVFAGLQKSFEGDNRIHIADESPNLRALRQKVATGNFQIALVEWNLVGWHDHESVKLVREISAHCFLVLMGMTESTRDRKRALEFGIRGIVSKRSTAHQVRKALCRVAEGGIWLEKAAAERLLDHVFSPPSEPQDEYQRIELLTRREREVIGLVCRGLRNKEIASTLFISESTVWHHLTSIFGKIQVTDRVSLVTFAFRHNLDTWVDRTPVAKSEWAARSATPVARMPVKAQLPGSSSTSVTELTA
jgi:DNA-binding NarL/FixJ family response regulator